MKQILSRLALRRKTLKRFSKKKEKPFTQLIGKSIIYHVDNITYLLPTAAQFIIYRNVCICTLESKWAVKNAF